MQNRITMRSRLTVALARARERFSFTRVFPVPLCLCGGGFAVSPPALAAAESMPAPVGAGSVLQVLLGLAVVLGLVFAAAWALRRFNPASAAGNGAIRIVAGTSVGHRERVLLLEVGGTWLVVGVAPGRVNSLHSMPKPADSAPAETKTTPAAPAFALWLRKKLESRNG